MASESECIKDINTLEKVLNDLECTRLFNIYFGISKEYYDENKSKKSIIYSSTNTDFYTIVLHPEFVNNNKDKIDKILNENGEIRKKKILEKLKNSDNKITLYIDKYLNDEKFLKDVINLCSGKEVIMIFCDVVPTSNLLFLFKKEKVKIFLDNDSDEFVSPSDDWITRTDYREWKSSAKSEATITYKQLLNSLDSFEELSKFNTITITNILKSIDARSNTNRKNLIDYRMEINSIYLNKVFNIIKKYRECGYNNNINIQCDSLYDIYTSPFNYESLGVTFGELKLDIDTINSYVYTFKKDASSIDSNLLLSEKLHYILKGLFKILKPYTLKSNKYDLTALKEQLYSLVYDIFKFAGLKPIKNPGENIYYFFEEHNPNIIVFNSNFIDSAYYGYDYKKISEEKENEIWNMSIENGPLFRDTFDSYYKYLLCNNEEEIEKLFLSNINKEDNLYLNDIDRYTYELNCLNNILMDLNEEDYIKYCTNKNYDDKEDIFLELNILANLIIKNKNKQIGIVINRKIN